MGFLKEEKAQATAEYILILAFVVALFVTLFKGVLVPMFSKFQTALSRKLQQLYSDENMHRLIFKVK